MALSTAHTSAKDADVTKLLLNKLLLTHIHHRGRVFCGSVSNHITTNANRDEFQFGSKVKVHTLDIAPLRSESPPQKCSGMARVLKGFHSFTCTLTRSSANGMSHTIPTRDSSMLHQVL